ncbi:restriction endonuclease subunit S [Nonomuraea purpurea]|uniref:Restriction endonuclease subunit S n=1 Tax=Nonomuraea purpurea TaxID=1849276 RepID=A0ABV8GU06_9ACTN
MNNLTLGESLELLIDNRGKNPPFTDTGIPVISAKHVKGGKLHLREARFVSPETYRSWMPVALMENDVILTSEAPLGRVALVKDSLPLVLAQRLYGLRGRRGVLDSKFLFYALQTGGLQAQLLARSSGTTVVGIRQPELLKLQIPAPDYPEQRKISALLGALDDKIAANDQIIAGALDLADALHAQAVGDSSPGEDTFASIAAVFGGGTPRTAEPSYWDGDILWTTPSDVTALPSPYLFGTKRMITSAGLESCASRLYPAGSIFMTSRATIGAFAVPQRPAAVNQGFIVVIPKDPALRWWLFHEMRSRVDEMLSLANGSTFLELSRKNFKAMTVRLASPEAIAEFDAKAEALHRRAAHAAQETQTLTELRDTLLPKLMSGAIKVRDAEKAVDVSYDGV